MKHTKVSRLTLLPIVAFTLLLMSLFQVSGAAAASVNPHMQGNRQHSAINPVFLIAPPHHTVTPIQPNPAPVSSPDKKQKKHCIGKGFQNMYYSTGTFPDYIDVFWPCPPYKHVGTYPTDANNGGGAYYGTNRLSVSMMDKTHGDCLILLDTNGMAPPGYVDSFIINPDGSLSPEISHLQVAGGGVPSDVHVVGDIVYVTSPGVDLESYQVGAGCVLTFLAMTSTSQFYINFALVGSTELVAPDVNTGNIDTYTLGSGGAITYLASAAGQVSIPDGVAVQTVNQVNNVFTGTANGGTATVQGGQLDPASGALAFLQGSPASDSQGTNGISLAFANKDNLLIEGETLSASLGVYRVKPGVPGTPGSISFLMQTRLAQSGSVPQAFGQSGKSLFVDGGYNGDVEACTLSGKGVSGCITVVVLTNPGGYSSGVAFC